MDCNKDQALRTKEAAEKKFAEEDYVGAKKLAQQAKDMYPGLDFISLFIIVIDVYLSREKIIHGQPDWHGVLGLESPATLEEKCRSHLNLYEDVKAGINHVIGAEEALQIISHAFRVLTGTFWAECPRCQFKFQYDSDIMNKEILCSNCLGSLPCGTHPMIARTTTHFQREKRSVVLALSAPSANPVGQRGRPKGSNRMKKDDGKSSRLGSPSCDVAKRSVVLALGAPSADTIGQRGRSKSVKKDDGRSSMVGSQRDDVAKRSVVLALRAPSADTAGQRGRSKRMTKDDGKSSMFVSPNDDDVAESSK